MEPQAPTRRENAAAFGDDDVVAAYRFRPPYPDSLIPRLIALVPGGVRTALELGCGTGELSRKLAPHVGHVDAVDPSAAMLTVARAASGGDASNISWIEAYAEDAEYSRTYDLVLAAESMHWLDWEIVTPRLMRAVSTEARLVVIARKEHAPWADAYREVAAAHSVISDYKPVDVPDELAGRGFWQIEGRESTPRVAFRQRVAEYVELQHSRSAFARYRIGDERAAALDDALRQMLEPHALNGDVEYEISVSFAWGRPRAGGDTLPA